MPFWLTAYLILSPPGSKVLIGILCGQNFLVRPKSSIVPVMPQCVECTRLRNIYLDIALKYRLAITASTARPAVYDLKKIHDLKMDAERILQAHELTHDPKPQAAELSVVESQEPDRNTGVILLPCVADERQALPATLHETETRSASSDAWLWDFGEEKKLDLARS